MSQTPPARFETFAFAGCADASRMRFRGFRGCFEPYGDGVGDKEADCKTTSADLGLVLARLGALR